MKNLALPLVLALFAARAAGPDEGSWKIEHRGLDSNLRGVSVAPARRPGQRAVWASGSRGVILRSVGGEPWQRIPAPAGETLDFRGVVAFGEDRAYLLASGEGEKSRIYRTGDGGKTWELQYTGARKEVFLDALVCADPSDCFALMDPMDGKFQVLRTTDGRHWSTLPVTAMPAALPGEGAFAASNTALALDRGGRLYFGTGGARKARVFRSADGGKSWTVAETPVEAGNPSSGIFSVLPVSGTTLVVTGGDYKSPERARAVAAYSEDGGKTWALASSQPGGFRSAVSLQGTLLVAVGPTGTDFGSPSAWRPADPAAFNALTLPKGDGLWAAGPEGTLARLVPGRAAPAR